MQGESLRNQDGVNEDRISELPHDLILHILSFRPTKQVIATSVLSKRWKSLWKMVRELEFRCGNMNTDKFSESVTSSLLSLKAPGLQSLHLKDMSRCNPIDIKLWVGIALTLHIRELVLKYTWKYGFRFPSNLFSSKTFETLKLDSYAPVDVPSSICMKSLRTLHLNNVRFEEDEYFCNLISGCPILEELFLRNLEIHKIETFNIVAPSVKRLSIYKDCKAGYVIKAPSLEYLKIQGWENLKWSLIENAPMLVEADISHFGDIGIEKIWGSLKSTKRLSFVSSHLHVIFQVYRY